MKKSLFFVAIISSVLAFFVPLAGGINSALAVNAKKQPTVFACNQTTYCHENNPENINNFSNLNEDSSLELNKYNTFLDEDIYNNDFSAYAEAQDYVDLDKSHKKISKNLTSIDEAKDITTFNFFYNGKSYKYRAKHFNIKTNTFELGDRMNKYARADTKEKKIESIQKMISVGIPLEMAFEYMYLGLRDKINFFQKLVFVPKKEATFSFNPNTEQVFEITTEVTGQKLDTQKLFKMLWEQYKKSNDIKINLPLILDRPTNTRKQFERLSRQRASFKTSYASSTSDRKHNIKTALSNFHGLVIGPSETVSFNTVVGRRTAERGYKTAKIILDGEFVDGVGGGVCQASTTLYNAVVLAGLKIKQVHRHSRRVSYVPPALDAMVNWGSSDLVFENNTDNPIYITTKFYSGYVEVKIFGQYLGEGVTHRTLSETIKTFDAQPDEVIVDYNGDYQNKVYYEDESFYIKPSKQGIEAKSYLVIEKNGVLIEKRYLRTETYPSERGIKIVGAHKRPAPQYDNENIWDFGRIFG